MTPLGDWIDQRTGLCSAWRDWLRRPPHGRPAWRRVWPATIAFVFFTQVVTGLALWMFYSPGAQSAWESVYYVQYHVQGGWLLRAVHHYSAQVMLALLGVWLVEMIFRGAYRAPREAVFWTVALMGLVTLALNLTGDLLPWDQNGYWSTRVRTGFLLLLPGVGRQLFELAAGGPDFGHLTLTRFVALHVGVFSGAFGLLLWARARLARRLARGLAPERSPQEPSATAKLSNSAYWPRQALRDAATCVAVLAVISALSLQHGLSPEHRGVALGSPADPAQAYEAARPEWSFRGLYQLRELFPPRLEIVPIFVIPGLVVLLLLAMPWIGRSRVGHGFNVAAVAVLAAGLAVLSWRSLAADAGSKDYQAALAAADWRAGEIKEMIAPEPDGPPRIPPGGALALQRRAAGCTLCHELTAGRCDSPRPEGLGTTAPHLYRFASREWLADFLDPKQISGPRFFGNTKFKHAAMPTFVKKALSNLDDEGKGDLKNLIAALSAEADLPSQRDMDARDAEKITLGRAALDTFGCTNCHKFRGQGKLGGGPDLTGYGSRSWLVGMIRNPADRRFYGSKNDRMPAYAATDNPPDNLLSDEDIGLLADWLRGQ
jgi:ubiquinol-cytochrome c reductase cytochrome b subunit